MKKIIIGFSKPRNNFFPVFSWLIRLYERTSYSHVYIRWETKWGTSLCYHAASVMLHFLGELAFKKKIHVIEEFQFEITDDQFDRLMLFCTTTSGYDYAVKEVFMIPLWDLGLIKQYRDDPTRQYCAELVIRALGEIDGVNSISERPDRIKLKEVYELVKKRAGSNVAIG